MKAYAVKHRDIETRLASRSGGVFTAITDRVLLKGGVVYGCRLDEQFVAIHDRATTREERDSFRGSKYVQSDKKNSFRQVKEDLNVGLDVVFSGTTCEVAGLERYLQGVDTSKLILVDILCHGVPSPLLWSKYLVYCQIKCASSGEIIKADFRNKKKYGWASNLETLFFSSGEEYSANDYASIFYSHYGLRPSCYKCPYKSIAHSSDFTLADCWGIDKREPDFNDNKGVSLLLINSAKAEHIFADISSELDYLEVNIKDYMQLPFRQSCKLNVKRRIRFWHEFETEPFSFIVKRYGAGSIEERIKKIVNFIFPSFLKDKIKLILGR